MQAVIALPSRNNPEDSFSFQSALLRRVCGVPLIARVVATAERAGADEILLISSADDPVEVRDVCLRYLKSSSPNFLKVVQTEKFDPASSTSWKNISDQLWNDFWWVPWNWVTYAHALHDLPVLRGRPETWSIPGQLLLSELINDEPNLVALPCDSRGVAVTSEASLMEAERFLVRHSGKRLDGIHSKVNRWLCRPVVRALTHTKVTPNIVTLAGLLFAVASAFCFARGRYLNGVTGAVLFFVSGLADEADGMLARLKFADSAFGCWFEGLVDNASYILLFLGVTLGLSAAGFRQALLLGGLALSGCSISIAVIALQRSRTTRPNHPNEYLGKVYGLLESDSGSFLSRITRQIHFVTKKGVLIHYVLLLTMFGWLRLMLWLVLVGSHLTWIMALYLDHRFFKPAHATTLVNAVETENGRRHP